MRSKNLKFNFLCLILYTYSWTLISCASEKLKLVDTGFFEIEVPNNWNYIKQQGDDSFIGQFIADSLDLDFDYSEFGYANHLLLTPINYLTKETYWLPLTPSYMKEGVTYTSSKDLISTRNEIMKEKGIVDTNAVRVEPFQKPEITTKEISDTVFMVTLKYKDTSSTIKVDLPEEIKNHKFEIDTIDKVYLRKIIYPKIGVKKGMIGVYFQDLHSPFNFQLSGHKYNLKNFKSIIHAFKTIKFKRKIRDSSQKY